MDVATPVLGGNQIDPEISLASNSGKTVSFQLRGRFCFKGMMILATGKAIDVLLWILHASLSAS